MIPRHRSRTEKIDLRGLRYNVRHWGPQEAPAVFFLHGRMDCSPTFQFVVDALQQQWHVIAPDWRGYGESEWLGRPYWFYDYYADLHALLEHYSPQRPARIVAHSKGANIAGSYAGARPERVAQLVMLDFLGLKRSFDDTSPRLIDAWLKDLRREPVPGIFYHTDEFAGRLLDLNPRLTAERAAFLARATSRVRDDGALDVACDPWQRIAAPTVYLAEDAMECWRKITAPVQLQVAEHGLIRQRFGGDPAEFSRRAGCFQNLTQVTVEDSGHNVQHDQPEQVAAHLEAFLTRD